MKINKVKIKNAESSFEEHEIGIDANNIHFSTTENAEQVIAAQNNNTSELDLQYQILEKEYNTSTPIEDYDLVRNIDKFEARPYDDEINKIKVAKIKKSDSSWGEEIELEAKSTGVALNNNKDAEAEITMLKNKVAALENIEKTLTPKLAQQIEEGKNFSIIGIDEDKDYDFKILGESKQETRSGKNLLQLGVRRISNGITTTLKEDGAFLSTGTITDTWADINDFVTQELLSGTYTISKTTKEYAISLYLIFEDNTYKTINISKTSLSTTFSISQKAKQYRFWIWDIVKGTTLNVTNYMQLELGSTATSFEPYGAMPSPDYPSEVESCGDNVNMFDKNSTRDSYFYSESGVKTSSSGNYFITQRINRTSDKYSVSFKNKVDGNGIISYVRFVEYKSDGTFIQRQTTVTNRSIITLHNETSYFLLNVDDGPNAYFEDLKVEKGSVSTPYSPYGQGCITEVICNKNLATLELEGQYRDYYSSGTITSASNIDSYIAKVEPNKTYYAQYTHSNLCFYDKNMKFISGIAFNGAGLFSTKGKENVYYVTVAVGRNNKDKIQIEEGSTATEYEEHKEQVYIIPTQQPFRAVEDYRDTFIKIGNKWFERHYIPRYIFTGNENITLSSDGLFYMDYFKTEEFNFDNCLCTHFKYYNNFSTFRPSIDIGFTFQKVHTSNIRIWFRISGITTVEDFKAWLLEQYNAGTPVYVDYILETPLDIECTEEQTKQLNKLYNEILSYDTRHIILEDELGNNYIEYYPDYSKPIVSNIEF